MAEVILFPSQQRLTKRELAAELRVSTRTIERWMAEGLPCEGSPRRRLFRRETVEAWLAERDPRLAQAVSEPTLIERIQRLEAEVAMLRSLIASGGGAA